MVSVASHMAWHAKQTWVVSFGCLCVLQISRRFPGDKKLYEAFMRGRGLMAIFNALKINLAAPYMTRVAVEAISVLSSVRMHDGWVLRCDCVDRVVTAMTSYPSEAVVQEKGYIVLANIAKHSEVCCQAVADRCGFENIRFTIDSYSKSEPVLSAMLEFLSAVSAYPVLGERIRLRDIYPLVKDVRDNHCWGEERADRNVTGGINNVSWDL